MSALGHKDIRGLDVAVHDSGGVRGVKSVRNLDAQRKNWLSLHGTSCDAVFQESRTIEELHGDE